MNGIYTAGYICGNPLSCALRFVTSALLLLPRLHENSSSMYGELLRSQALCECLSWVPNNRRVKRTAPGPQKTRVKIPVRLPLILPSRCSSKSEPLCLYWKTKIITSVIDRYATLANSKPQKMLARYNHSTFNNPRTLVLEAHLTI